MAIDPNAEILTASELTVKAAKTELDKNLDYSIHSLKDLETLIQHVKNHFSNLKKEGKLTEQTIQHASGSIGAYLGEAIRRRYGGTWTAKNPIMKTLVINGQEFSPILYVFERLTKDVDYSLDNYLSDINQKLYPPEDFENKPPITETPKKTANSFMGNRSLIIGGIIGLAVLCFIGILAVTIYSNIKRTNEFKAKVNSFVVEANKLNSMTEQGVTYDEFRTQLVEAKSAYALIDYWPSSYRNEKLAFDKALEGWDWTLKVWEFAINDPKIEFNRIVGIYFDNSVINYLAEYAGVKTHTAGLMTIDEWIAELMTRASTYFEAGRAGIK